MVEELAPADLKRRLEAGDDVTVVDIRGEDDYRAGHIPGADNVPFHSFAQEIEDRTWRGDVVVACPVGQSSQKAARLLASYEGVDAAKVYNLDGGYRAWEYELETGDGDAGNAPDAGDGAGEVAGGDADGRAGRGDGDGSDAGDAAPPF